MFVEERKRSRRNMRMSSNQKPSFFKVLSNMDFTNLLRVAPAFFRKYGLTPPENVNLRVHSGRTWRVKVERSENDDGLFCFTKGWPSFAQDAGLQLGEFLVLSLLREWEFDVAIYDTSFCGREIPAAGVELKNHQGMFLGRNERKRTRRSTVPAGSSKESDPLYFEVYLKRLHKSRLFVSQTFLEAAGLKGKKRVKLEYAAGGNGSSKYVELNKQKIRVDLAAGWPQFRTANRLEYGKTYSFRFISAHNVIRVQELD